MFAELRLGANGQINMPWHVYGKGAVLFMILHRMQRPN